MIGSHTACEKQHCPKHSDSETNHSDVTSKTTTEATIHKRINGLVTKTINVQMAVYPLSH